MDLETLQNDATALQSQLDDLAVNHYTSFLSHTSSTKKLTAALDELPESISSSTSKINSLSSTLSSSQSELSALSSSHSSSRSSISDLPPLLTLLESPQLIDLLIRTNKYSQAVQVSKHVLSLPATSIIEKLQNSILHGPYFPTLIKSIVSHLQTIPHSTSSTPPPHSYFDLISALQDMYDLITSHNIKTGKIPPSSAPNTPVVTSFKLRKVFLDSRERYLDTVVLQHSPLSMDEILNSVSDFRSCMFDLITNYNVLFPPSDPSLALPPAVEKDRSLLLATFVHDKTEAFVGRIASYTSSMHGMTLSSVKDVLESLDFLSTSMRVFWMLLPLPLPPLCPPHIERHLLR